MSSVALFTLGLPRIERDGVSIQVHRRRAIALLVYLAVTERTHSRDTLATLFYPEYDQGQARAGLRRTLSTLRNALGEGWLDVDLETVRINSAAAGQKLWLDVAAFQELLAECQSHGHPPGQVCPACLPLLTKAAALYRDDFLAGFSLRDSPGFDDWQSFQTQSLRNQLASVLERLAYGHGSHGQFEQAVIYARRWVTLDPLNEPAHCCLMRLYARSGQRAAALQQYAECENALREDLKVSPQEATVQLLHAIQTGDDLPPDAPSAPVAVQAAASQHNLPAQLTPFVGREDLLTEIAERLQDPACRLLTLVGPGGIGKTRLAVEAARAHRDGFADGVFFVSLAPLQSVDAMVPAVAQALGFSFYHTTEGGPSLTGAREVEAGFEPRQQLLDYLHPKSVLLVMDNFEHLLGGVGLVTDILQAAPAAKVVVTSRTRLNVQAEHLFPVPGMSVPGETTVEDRTRKPEHFARYSAIALFLATARRVQPGFGPTEEDLLSVARICRQVQGVPLAILMAAAWIEVLCPAEIAAEIGQSLGLLESDLHDLPERQRSMRAVFDHSWDLLAEADRGVFQSLAVFCGGFTRNAAQAIAGASLRDLMTLTHNSLLHRTPGGRYEIAHELLRQYAAEKLDASGRHNAVRDVHGGYYAAELERWDEELKGPRQQTALAEMNVEIENARRAWDWAMERGQMRQLDRALDGLCRFHEWRWRYQEGEELCRTAVEELSATTLASTSARRRVEGLRVWARALAWQSVFSRALGHTELADKLLRQGLALLERPVLTDQDVRRERAFILQQMGHMRTNSDREQARRLYQQSLSLYQALGDRYETACNLEALGGVFEHWANYEEAKRLAEQSLALRRSLDDRRGIAESLVMLGRICLFQAQYEDGERFVRESVAICREMADPASVVNGIGRMGLVLFFLGKYAERLPLREEALSIYSDLGLRRGIAESYQSLCTTQLHLGQYEKARTYGQMSLDLWLEIGEQWRIGYALYQLSWMALAEGSYSEAHRLSCDSLAVLRRIGQQSHVCNALATLSVASYRLGQLAQAEQHLCEALRIATEIRDWLTLMSVLPTVALVLADKGEAELAVELYALASRYPCVSNSRWYEDFFGRHITTAASTLPPDVFAAAQERGRQRDLRATVEELLTELGE